MPYIGFFRGEPGERFASIRSPDVCGLRVPGSQDFPGDKDAADGVVAAIGTILGATAAVMYRERLHPSGQPLGSAVPLVLLKFNEGLIVFRHEYTADEQEAFLKEAK